MSAKREYLWAVFKDVPQSVQLVEAALIFYHAEVPVEQVTELDRHGGVVLRPHGARNRGGKPQ